ncbi:serine/threonine-protein kinase [Actinacidiphila yeochonensis]|uniref:serine/threonine-protein kinase n=1 Tax=Actinacidiphila yeochonensis TaxID=89050 RepID=UPI002AFEB697|nr:protein kinase [Actinacidiphila yeochonensis]
MTDVNGDADGGASAGVARYGTGRGAGLDGLRDDDPRWIGGYRLLGRLGAGGMGRVYLARSGRGRTVAVKLVRPDLAEGGEFRDRFRREVRAARRVGGRWTAPVLDSDTEADLPWVATGYVPGLSLRQIVKEYGPLPEPAVRVLADGLARALADVHGAELVHRDLKPSNVMITIDGPRVIDFGIVRALETTAEGTLTATGALVGSPGFMAPEQVRGEPVTPACDVFCLGLVLAYAAAGRPPFGSEGSGVHSQLYRIAQEPPDLEPVPEGLRALVTACLVKAPAGRPSLEEVHALIGPLPQEGGEPWLPAAIVARLGRHAARLLELEAEAESAPEPGTEQPTREQRPAPEPPEAREAAGPPEPSDRAATAATAATAVTPPRPAREARAPGRRRALVAGLAVLAVVAGGTAAYVAVHGRGSGGRPAAGATGPGTAAPSRASAAASSDTSPTSAPGASAGPSDAAVPADLVGTWRTSFSTVPAAGTDGTAGTNVRTLTIDGDGDVRLTGTGTAYVCAWRMRVTSLGPPVALSSSSVVSGDPVSSCSPGAPTTLDLLDSGHLRRDTEDGKAPLTYTRVG